MESRILSSKNREASLYTFYSAKKIYLAYTPSKYFLIEKKNSNTISLCQRRCTVSTKDNGLLLFPAGK